MSELRLHSRETEAEPSGLQVQDVPRIILEAFADRGLAEQILGLAPVKEDVSDQVDAARSFLADQGSDVRHEFDRYLLMLPGAERSLKKGLAERSAITLQEKTKELLGATSKLPQEVKRRRIRVPEQPEVRAAWIQGQVKALSKYKTRNERVDAWRSLQEDLQRIREEELREKEEHGLLGSDDEEMQGRLVESETARKEQPTRAVLHVSPRIQTFTALENMFAKPAAAYLKKIRAQETKERMAAGAISAREQEETIAANDAERRTKLARLNLSEDEYEAKRDVLQDAAKLGMFEIAESLADAIEEPLEPKQYGLIAKHALETGDLDTVHKATVKSEDAILAEKASQALLVAKRPEDATQLRALARIWRKPKPPKLAVAA